MKLSGKIDSIELKVRELSLRLERLKKENAALLEENTLLNDEVSSLRKALAALEEYDQNNGQRRNERESIKEGEESDKLRAQLNQYIREIDQCIEWLNNN